MQVYVLVFLTEDIDVIRVFDTKDAAIERLIKEALDWNCYMYPEQLKEELTDILKDNDEFVNCHETGTMWRIETWTINK